MKTLSGNRVQVSLARPEANERGSAIVVALLVLALGTIIGIAAVNTSSMERQSAFNFLIHERTFYTAEAGLERAKEVLKMEFSRQTAPSNPTEANWSFALATATDSTYDGGVKLLNNQTLDGNSYTVTIWDNKDEIPAADKPKEDKDRMIWLRSEASEPGGSKSTIETLLRAKDFQDIRGYDTQSYGGPDKASTSNDKNAISDFTKRL
jgi:hypothetical protein